PTFNSPINNATLKFHYNDTVIDIYMPENIQIKKTSNKLYIVYCKDYVNSNDGVTFTIQNGKLVEQSVPQLCDREKVGYLHPPSKDIKYDMSFTFDNYLTSQTMTDWTKYTISPENMIRGLS